MDASAPPNADATENNVFDLFLNLNCVKPSEPALELRPKTMNSTIIKFTKLPDGPDKKEPWPTESRGDTNQPRQRRLITIVDDAQKTNRSLKSNGAFIPNAAVSMAANYTKRKSITITEDGKDLRPKLTSRIGSNPGIKRASTMIETDYKKGKQLSRDTTPKISSSRCTRDSKANSISSKRETTTTQQRKEGKQVVILTADTTKSRPFKDKGTLRNSKNVTASKTCIKKTLTKSESDNEISKQIKKLLYDDLKTNIDSKKPGMKPIPTNQSSPRKRSPPSRPSSGRGHQPSTKIKHEVNIYDFKEKRRPLTILIPLSSRSKPSQIETRAEPEITPSAIIVERESIDLIDKESEEQPRYKDMHSSTEPKTSQDKITQMDDLSISLCKCESAVQTGNITGKFDSLEIPNVTLTKEKIPPDEEITYSPLAELPNLQIPPFKISPQKDEPVDLRMCKSASYVYSRATLTYTTRHKFNFQVVGNEQQNDSSNLPSPLNYPINVMSVFKKESKTKNQQQENVTSVNSYQNNNNVRDEIVSHTHCLNELNLLNCSYVFDKLMKPSDIISTIKVNNGLLQNDYICEQFQRELNFIDSFFESLKYLESCSLTEKCFPESKVETLVNNSVLFDNAFDPTKNSDYDTFLSKLENGANIDDTETMASKSLFLLNMLIRDEQRRAKNLLFVLKMREDALKDFTKSQILWLENKKKYENTDISTLKKKQRGALVKLQHECGEMQRMRKALLTLSEKRKVALLKTKKSIELKLKDNVDVEQIILDKKKLKRSNSSDRSSSPLKCFDLSSSGGEDTMTSKPSSEVSILAGATLMNVSSAEKCVQTTNTIQYKSTEEIKTVNISEIAANCVAVDGGYLNILFHDLMLPQIFSSGKQYEVNEEALKNIVSSTNNYTNNLSGSEVVEKLMDQLRSKDGEASSPSTARSLLDEFDQYYRVLVDEDKSPCSSPKHVSKLESKTKEAGVQSELKLELVEEARTESTSDLTMTLETNLSHCKTCVCESFCSLGCECLLYKEPEVIVSCGQTQTGPLPVPVGAAAETSTPDITPWVPSPLAGSTVSEENISELAESTRSSSTSSQSPVQSEAEELRRQQLEIEREIKALEQQQNRLMVVREIPDKPPPPYTPPTDSKPKPPRLFAVDENSEEKIEKYITETTYSSINDSKDSKDAFDEFLSDYCKESLENHKQEQSDNPWDACNLLPQKPSVDMPQLVQKTSVEIKEVLTSVPSTAVSGVSSRRSDHIDDILFAEWRRCEPEWTNLHTDEAIVKSQIFESIFQKILTETVDQYKKTVATD